ncbi:hypothetical protein [Actibacterium sp. 188UL27-1]|uniref:hypothetical protein n=1 Tax=Actibacterium sp. 188UL27-1 TaxID=2786961 RepID=UPI001959FB2B|nr:hypothetical protein [Actibacterium sp. 188UL27-1]MBM7069850.1 hypothetical protein [Actibacterium sp. 188UL27-1]
MIVYSHRFQGVLQQVVLDLGLGLTLSDSNSPVSLKDNEIMFSDLANSMNIEMTKDHAGPSVTYTFRKRS